MLEETINTQTCDHAAEEGLEEHCEVLNHTLLGRI